MELVYLWVEDYNNIELFKLQEVYKQHKDIIVELLIKKAYYPQSYIEKLENSFGSDKDEIGLTHQLSYW